MNFLFDLFRPWNTFNFSNRVTLPNSFELLLKMIEKCKDPGIKSIKIDLSDTEYVDPPFLVFCTALEKTFPNIRFEVVLSQNSKVHEYLTYAGFADVFKMPEFKSGIRSFKEGDVLKLEVTDRVGNTAGKAQWFVDQVNRFSILSPAKEAIAIDSVEEILRNILQHSRCTQFVGLGQHHPNSKKVTFAFYDNGIGIKKHITLRPYNKHHKVFRRFVSATEYKNMRKNTADYAIEIASRECVSGTDYIENSGAGLNFLISDFSSQTSGAVIVISQEGLVFWEGGEIAQKMALPHPIQGTFVSITASQL